MMHSSLRRGLHAALVCSLGAGLASCAKDDVEEARKRMGREAATPPPASTAPAPGASPHGGMPPGGAPPMATNVPTDGALVPLKQSGLGSAVELKRELAKLGNEQQAAQFETAFRLTFTADPQKRDYRQAQQILEPLLQAQPRFAPAYRTLAYAEFNMNPTDPGLSLQHYEKAVELDPNYGEAHYAIAFMCAATGELDKGIGHYKKAMALGVQDEHLMPH
jgi:tetratricopeptide (TPR) repeat protein